jgi:hypothetical protein
MIDAKFEYKPHPHYRLAHCRVRIYEHEGQQVVVATEMEGNPGMSVTNAAEDIATQLAAAYNLEVDRLIWIEHYCYPDEGHIFDLVRFTWEGGKASDPQWRRITFEEVERLTGDDAIAGEILTEES